MFEPGPTGTLSYEYKQPLPAGKKTVQVTPQVMQMLGELLEREVTRDDPEWAAAMESLTVSEKVKIMLSRRQHKENKRDCRTIVEQLVSSIHQNVLTIKSYKRKEHVKRKQRKTVTFEDQNQKSEEVEQNLGQESLSGEKVVDGNKRVYQRDPGQESLSGESAVEEIVHGEEQDLEDNFFSGELRRMSRAHKTDPEGKKCSVTDFSDDDNSKNSKTDTYSDRNSNTGSELSELTIHTLLVETRATDLDRELYQDPDSDRYLLRSETVFDNAADDLETIAVPKRSMSLLPQKEVVRTDLQPFRQETEPLAKIWCVKMEDDKHQPDEANSHLRVLRTYL